MGAATATTFSETLYYNDAACEDLNSTNVIDGAYGKKEHLPASKPFACTHTHTWPVNCCSCSFSMIRAEPRGGIAINHACGALVHTRVHINTFMCLQSVVFLSPLRQVGRFVGGKAPTSTRYVGVPASRWIRRAAGTCVRHRVPITAVLRTRLKL